VADVEVEYFVIEAGAEAERGRAKSCNFLTIVMIQRRHFPESQNNATVDARAHSCHDRDGEVLNDQDGSAT
jgi:predicted lipid-binding transport protein (Tim44 family)